MKSTAITLAAIFVLATSAFAQSKYTLDKYHSRLSFSVKHLGISNVEGIFKSFDVTVNGSKPDFSDLKVEMQAQISSINTEIEKRDQHLQSPDFFDAAKYPAIVFKSSSFRKIKGNVYKLSGTISMKGVSKPISFTVIHASGKNPMNGKTVHGFTLSGTLNRLDFGVGDITLKTGIGSEVKLTANVEFTEE